MSEQNQQEVQKVSWKTRIYLIGSVIGAVMGFMSAYLFTKEAEDINDDKDKAPDVPPTALLGLALSAISLVRQIAEVGRKKKDGKK